MKPTQQLHDLGQSLWLDNLRLFSCGKNAGHIARTLRITPQTLRNHLHHINQKLHTHNRLEAVTHAMQRQLL